MVKLNSICNFQEGYVNPSQKEQSYFDGPIKWCRANDVNYTPTYETSRTLSNKGFKSAGKSAILFNPNTIVITKSGTIGRVAIVKDYMCGNRAIINIELKNKSIIDTKYIYYWLSIKKDYLNSIAVGSVQKNLYTSILGDIEIPFFNEDYRNHIVNTISSVLISLLLCLLIVYFL